MNTHTSSFHLPDVGATVLSPKLYSLLAFWGQPGTEAAKPPRDRPSRLLSWGGYLANGVPDADWRCNTGARVRATMRAQPLRPGGTDQHSAEASLDTTSPLAKGLTTLAALGMSVSPRLEPLATLQAQYRGTTDGARTIRRNLGKLAENFDWRRIRGDGDCFYRALYLAILEADIAARPAGGSTGRLSFHGVCNWVDQRLPAHRSLVARVRSALDRVLRASNPHGALFQAAAHNAAQFDTDAVCLFRVAAADFLAEHADDFSLTGVSYSLQVAPQTCDAFCRDTVLPRGVSAEGPVLDALARVCRVNVYLHQVFRGACVLHQLRVDAAAPTVHLLFKPGHFDLLREKAVAVPVRKHNLSGFVVPQMQHNIDASPTED